ncbi:protein TonB [Altererythrobacter atlanticus]|uniref:Gram-negative bacterial tonB protein n=1 Tax=Croceibacterium atlanticum TaxID=1267766 RepID=A0A0F7KNE9_9SPHN|nr:energy transducer TonB [Croceibacterium atlanticum]AKH42038.1 Gram-negative bacterial tonB protein [Croceibacterium atlanticum]MBB5733394.1 protein TonB [Croceibacterium atlanticum]
MTYLNRTQDNKSRAIAIASVGAIHAAIGLAVVTGLTVSGVIELEDGPLIAQSFPTAPPPPPQPVPTEQPPTSVVTLPTAPVPPLDLSQPTTPEVAQFDPGEVTVKIPSNIGFGDPTVIPPLPPRPLPSFAPVRAAPANDAARWITADDYPGVPLRRNIEGVSAYRLVIGTNGRVNACEITASSGNRMLDEATCKLISRRARFEPATDGSGTKIVGDYTGTVRWQIPD